ncbi:FtsK/SpoIIIE domain-containing protein [Luedemannella helvata]|uniref:FtsK domain-containing protein n=1 Tax=Luedemannella helvata TaxID=349315 RepID=A0ABN2L827_9ACTN
MIDPRLVNPTTAVTDGSGIDAGRFTAWLSSPALPLAIVGVLAAVGLWWLARHVVRYLVTPAVVRPMLRRAWRIKRRWKRTARRVGLVQVERGRPGFWSSAPATTVVERELIPPVRVQAQDWGVAVDVATLGRTGLAEFQRAAAYLADVWQVPQVRVERLRPGWVRLRAIVHDPLTQPLSWAEPVSPSAGRRGSPRRPVTPGPGPSPDLRRWAAGVDADGQPVDLRSESVSGIVVAGLAGYGKTSFLNARFCDLAPSPAVQFVLIDGKGGPDYDDLFPRAWLSAKDDPSTVRDHLARVRDLMVARQHAIRTQLGVKNLWRVGPTTAWPLVVVVIDEAHTFLNETKGTDPDSKKLDALARESARLVEELVRKGRNVGVQVILATQKATGDAIPTKIRDNCQVAVSFAQRTSEAATAVLGSDITGFPDEHPRRLQDPAYVGVASMIADGRPGFTLVRTRHVSDEVADRIAASTAQLVRDPHQLLIDAARAVELIEEEDGGPFRQEPTAALPTSPIHRNGKDLW